MKNEGTLVTCGQCRGQGTTVWNGIKAACLGCHGTGKIKIVGVVHQCGQCRGHGTLISKGRRIQCTGCKGSGYTQGN